MSWRNIKLVFHREVRDQLRDRRTLFMVAVLPVFFYPLLGLALFQATHFLRQSASEVLVVGHEEIEGVPGLIEEGQFADPFVDGDPKLLELTFRDDMDGAASEETLRAKWRELVASGEIQAVVYFPPDFAQRMQDYRRAVGAPFDPTRGPPELPYPRFVYDSGQEKSELAYNRVARVLTNWANEIGRQNLRERQIPESVASPKAFESADLAAESGRGDAKLWAKILPFVLVIWAVTGAFYPAVDLCAGEKERGTLETLLSSPADRGEIVIGKLLTVMTFSMATAILNVVSMGITCSLIVGQLRTMPGIGESLSVGMPSPWVALWSLVVLVPVAAFFSAVCLALAAFARSTKEGQYYLMPVILITMPLIVIPMSPTAELTLGNSLIPVTGIVLMLRELIEGTFARNWPLAIPVMVSTFAYCYLAIRWAIEQFNSEKVLFRAADRWNLGHWLRHLLRDREATPTVAMAAMCGLLILMLRFFMSFATSAKPIAEMHFVDFAQLSVVTQMVVILTPALLMTVMLTRSARQTLRLGLPHWAAVPLAVLLAVAVHPWVLALQYVVRTLYPTGDLAELNFHVTRILGEAPNIFWALAIIALLPAVCEELAFRGFILSGFRHLGNKWRAIALSSLFFGVSHGILQQSMIATVVGCLIGFLAVQTGSIWTGMAYHLVHNSIVYVIAAWTDGFKKIDHLMWTVDGEAVSYAPWILLISGLSALTIVYWFLQLPYRRTDEEARQESIERETIERAMMS